MREGVMVNDTSHESRGTRISIRGDRSIARAAIDLAKLRFATALGRFESRIDSLVVRVGDVNGPRGGDDKRCAVTLRLTAPRRVVIVEDTDPSAEAAISRVADRVGRAVARLVATHNDRHWGSAR
jgi:putative sigma-54 modulation protein